MSIAPTSLAPSASSEAFAHPASLSHGAPDHLSSGIFEPLLQSKESECNTETIKSIERQKREKLGRKNGGGALNPFAKEFVPVTDSRGSGRGPNIAFDPQAKGPGGRNKGSYSGKPWRARGGQDGFHKNGVIFREDVKNSYGISPAGTSHTNSGRELSTGLSKGGHGQTSQRGFRVNGDQSAAMRTPTGHASSSHNRALGASTTPLGSRKGQAFNANYLLNFQYDPITRPSPRAPAVRRPQKPQPFNKELFLQANFRFLVSDFGDYMLNTSDPDKMLEWEDVAAVNFAAPLPVQCPICLDRPLCPQITLCGHIFCFPCLLRYLLIGVQEIRGDHWKKCPLCFAMISAKELRTLFIDDVHQHSVGDRVKFTRLIRAKGSIIPFENTELAHGPLAYSKDGQCHLYSKFTLTPDAEPTTSKAVNELTMWAEQVQQLGGEDMDLLPFVFVAIDQLRQRKDSWSEHRATAFLSSSPQVRQRILAQATSMVAKIPSSLADGTVATSKSADADLDVLSSLKSSQNLSVNRELDVVAETEAAMAELKEKAHWVYERAFSDDESETVMPLGSPVQSSNQSVERGAQRSDQSLLEISVKLGDNGKEVVGEPGSTAAIVPGNFVEKKDQQTKKDQDERDTYTFYQSTDGQMLILHPLNVKCLLQHYGKYEALPTCLEAEIIELETVTQTDATRKRYRYLSHLPLTAIFQLCEVDLSNHLPSAAFSPFSEELCSRESRRRRILKEDRVQRELEEKAAAAEVARYSPPTDADFKAVLRTVQIEGDFSRTDLEDPCDNAPLDTPSPTGSEERKLFSRVAKLGFASGYDAPDLMSKRPADSPYASSPTSAWETGATEAGSSRGPISFADIIVAQVLKVEHDEGVVGKKMGTKKGKKGSKVIMSTAGGRRY